MEKVAWATDSHVGPYADRPVLTLFSRTSKALIPRAAAGRLAADEAEPRRPSQGEGTRPPPAPLAADHRRCLDSVLHHHLLPHRSLGRVRILALLCGTGHRLLRDVLRVDLLQCRRDGRGDDPIKRRRPDDLGWPEGRETEHSPDRRL